MEDDRDAGDQEKTERRERLLHEFEARDGSFLMDLRCNLFWSRPAFLRLVTAMQEAIHDDADRATIERWVAEGFWYVSYFVKDWSTHPDFPKDDDRDYYERAYARLQDLAFWYFAGHCPLETGALPDFA